MLRGFSPEERREVRRQLGLIQLDPLVDGVHKILFAPHAVYTTYVTRQFWIYYFVEGGTITFADIDRATDYEPIPR